MFELLCMKILLFVLEQFMAIGIFYVKKAQHTTLENVYYIYC